MHTYTYVTVAISPAAFDEIKGILRQAGYGHAIHDDGRTLDMHGLALQPKTARVRAPRLARSRKQQQLKVDRAAFLRS